jgi:RNA polymerase sigma factor (TIGR02999 family)
MREDITQLLGEAARGSKQAQAHLLPLIYEHLHRMAARERGSAREQTLSTTALVNEAYLHLFSGSDVSWENRRVFYSYAARAMRNIVIDYARRASTEKRGDGMVRVDPEVLAQVPDANDPRGLIDLDRALSQLETSNPRLAEVASMHVFSGLEFGEIAACLQVTERTVYRDWQKARAFLASFLSDSCTP